MVKVLKKAIGLSRVPSPTKDILAIGLNSVNSNLAARIAFSNYQKNLSFSYDIMDLESDLVAVQFANYRSLYMPSDQLHIAGGISCSIVSYLGGLQSNFAQYINVNGGSVVSLTQGGCGSQSYGWLPSPLIFVAIPSSSGPGSVSVALATAAMNRISPSLNVSQCCYVTWFTGPVGYNGMDILATDHSGTLHSCELFAYCAYP